MTTQAFTSNFADNSSEAGFQFTFYCDLCREGFKTSFIESKNAKKAGFLRGLGQAVSMGASILGRYNVGYNMERGAEMLAQRFTGMSPEWRKEHDEAFEKAQNEAKEYFKNHKCNKVETKQTICPKCGKPAGEGKFCVNCGASLDLIQCPKCGASSQAGTKFCGECGGKIV